MANNDQVIYSPDGTALYLVAQVHTTPVADSTPKTIAVESLIVKLLTPLEDGAANDGTQTNSAKGTTRNTQKGMVYGKRYDLIVVQRDTGQPNREVDYHWQIAYQSPETSQNARMTKQLIQHGYKITVELDDPDMCGCDLTITAYETTPEQGSDLKVFAHNRFRWFDGQVVKEQIEGRTLENWRINQGNSCLCGMAAVYYAMLKKHPDQYKKLAKELHRTGHYLVNGNDLLPAPSMYDVDPDGAGYAKMKIPEIDWIVLAGTRSALSASLRPHSNRDEDSFGTSPSALTYGYNGIESTPGADVGGINTPGVMKDAITKFSGCEIVDTQGMNLVGLGWKMLFSPGADAISALKDIDEKFNAKSQVLMMICADMLDGNKSGIGDRTTRLHWVAYAGGLDLSIPNKVKFKVYTWGTDPDTGLQSQGRFETIYERVQEGEQGEIKPYYGISEGAFSSNYFGCIAIK